MSSWLSWSFSKVCEPVRQGSESADRLAAACWWFCFSKSIELMDTVSNLSFQSLSSIAIYKYQMYHGFVKILMAETGIKPESLPIAGLLLYHVVMKASKLARQY